MANAAHKSLHSPRWHSQRLAADRVDAILASLEIRAAPPEWTAPGPSPRGDSRADWRLSALPRTVVVIDDELDNVNLTVMVLQSAGHRAVGATEGRAGLKLAVDHVANVVVLDHLMPDMNGAEVGKALRAHPITRDIRILMHSGTPEATIRASFTQYDAYLAKPARGWDLLHAIEAL